MAKGQPAAPVWGTSWFYRAAESLYNDWPSWLSNLATLALAVDAIWFGLNPHKNHWEWGPRGLLIFSAALWLWAEQRSRSRSRRLTDLQASNDELEYAVQESEDRIRDLFREQLRILADSLALANTERISAYSHDEDGDVFRLASRFSQNPAFDGPGRPAYAKDQGCIAEAWRAGESVAALPDKRVDEDAYFNNLEATWKIPREIAQRFSMTSRHMAGFALRDDRGDYIAVLIFESERDNFLDLTKIRKAMITERKRLSLFVQDSGQVGRQHPEIAAKAGL